MTLATKCPHCRATFKVAHDQLKLRAGLVRCGICQHIFNGVEHLVEQPEPATEEKPIEQKYDAHDTHDADFFPDALTNTAPPHSPPTLSFTESDAVEEVIVLKANLIDLEPRAEKATKKINLFKPSIETEQTADPAEQASIESPHSNIDTHTDTDSNTASHKEIPYQHMPKQTEATDIEQPSFIRQARKKKRRCRMILIGTLVLSLLLVGQTTYLFRDLIAATFPASKSTLDTLCQYARCQIQLPMHIESISYEADELLSLSNKNNFEFSLILRNRGQVTQAWPHIELTLKNAQKQVVLRRVFASTEYLTNEDEIRTGFPAQREQAVKLFFKLDQLPATDYSVALFYP